jgi:hypothetical protein
MKRALDRPFRPPRSPRAGRARARGRGAGREAARVHTHRTGPSGYAPAPRGCVDSSRSCRNKTTHPSWARRGVSTHDGDAGTSRHTRPQVARRRSPRRPGRPEPRTDPGRPPGRRGQRAGSDPGRPRARVRARVSAERVRSLTASPAAVQTTPSPPPPNPRGASQTADPARARTTRRRQRQPPTRIRPGADHPRSQDEPHTLRPEDRTTHTAPTTPATHHVTVSTSPHRRCGRRPMCARAHEP